jgi:hypothetical protein
MRKVEHITGLSVTLDYRQIDSERSARDLPMPDVIALAAYLEAMAQTRAFVLGEATIGVFRLFVEGKAEWVDDPAEVVKP